MAVKILEYDKKSNKALFVLKDSDTVFANTLRRVIIDEVPTMAIEDVEFRKNNSVLYDEIVAHRLGLVALKTDLKSYNLPSECKCEGAGCARCQVKLTLSSSEPGYVHASELKSADPKIIPVYPETPIAKLIKGQKIELEATATLGKGKQHAKWSPGHAYYKHRVAVNMTKKVENPEKIIELCPKGVFEMKDGKLAVNQPKLDRCDLCGACEEAAKNEIKLERRGEILFYLESWGQLSCKEIIDKASDILKKQLEEFQENLEEKK